MTLPACGKHEKKCGYRTIYKTCKKPKEFKCKDIILPKDSD